jgi:glyoxylase-like metal-dependent hydrolase (beta-lactamase superfamily II)
MKIGPYQIKLLETGHFWLDGGAMFGVVPKTLWNQTNPSDEKNRIELAMRVLLVLFEDRKILVDVGAGHKYSSKQQEIFRWNNSKSDLKRSLHQHGILPEEITDVVLTHCHFDHAGGGTEVAGGTLQLTFPNAHYYVQSKHWQWALSPTDRDRGSFLKDDIEPLRNYHGLRIIPGESELFPGFYLLLSNGHTPGLQMVKIQDSSQTLFYCGDLMPTTTHLALPYIMGYDLFPLTTLEEKQRYLEQACSEDWIIVFEHDPNIGAVRIRRGNKRMEIREAVQI